MTASLTAVARRLAFVREADGPNRGAWVEKFQRDAGGIAGDSWCADFVSFVLDVAYHGASPLPRSGSCQRLLESARARGYVVEEPQPDDLYFFLTPAGTAHHAGIVTVADPLTGIAGNTSEDGASVNGSGVFEHGLAVPRSLTAFARLP